MVYIPTEYSEKTQTYIRACPYSDHSAVKIIITPTTQRRKGRGFWKMNVNILKDEQYQRTMKAFLTYIGRRSRKTKYDTSAEWWDTGTKTKVKAITISHCVRKAKAPKTEENKLLHATTKRNETTTSTRYRSHCRNRRENHGNS